MTVAHSINILPSIGQSISGCSVIPDSAKVISELNKPTPCVFYLVILIILIARRADHIN
jgi:hypothetical protein